MRYIVIIIYLHVFHDVKNKYLFYINTSKFDDKINVAQLHSLMQILRV